MTVNQRIKGRRLELGLTVDEVAAELGVSRATVYRYESAEIANMGIDKLEPMAAALETTPAYLMGWTDDPYNYDEDPDGRMSEISSLEYEYLYERYHGNPRQMWYAHTNNEEAIRQEAMEDRARHAAEVSPVEHTPTQKRLQLVARHLDKLPENIREKMLANFESTIDMYLEAVKDNNPENK